MTIYVVNKGTGSGVDVLGIYSTREKALDKVQWAIDNDWCQYRKSDFIGNVWEAVNYDDIWLSFYETKLDKDCIDE